MVERFNRRLSDALQSQPPLRPHCSNRFRSHAERNAFITRVVDNYNRTRLKCLNYHAPLQLLQNLTGQYTYKPAIRSLMTVLPSITPLTPGMHLGPRTRHHPQAAPGHPQQARQEGPRRSRCERLHSSSEPITLREPVPPVPCLDLLQLSHTIPGSFSGKLVGQFCKTAVALRYAMMVPVHLKFSLTRPSSRPVSGALYRPFYCQCSCRSASVVTLRANEAIHRPPPSRRRSRDRPASCHGRPPGAPAPC